MITRSKVLLGLGILGVLSLANPALVKAGPASICDSVSGNLIVNCGFELGLVNGVPVGWTVNAGFLAHLGGFDRVVNSNANSGANALQFGNLDSEPFAEFSQTFADTVGQTYTGNFFMFDGGAASQDPNAFFDAQLNGSGFVSLSGLTAPATYTEFTFSFVGSGTDTLSFAANTDPSEFYVDDVSVVPNGTTTTPEPTSIVLLGSGLAGLWFKRRGAKTA